VQPLKQASSILTVELGMLIEPSRKQFSKSFLSNFRTLDPVSKRAVNIALHPRKQDAPILATEEGMQIV
jgi:hypothetical protein